jgi:hypothetical protein
MLRTEDKARECWCPHSRVVHTECDYGAVVSANSFGDGVRSVATRCIASDCMAWRWERHTEVGKEVRGYCGAFGEPEA